MNTAKGVIVNISGGNDMTLLEVDHAANIIRQSVNPDANINDGSCSTLIIEGCMDPAYLEYNPNANIDDASCNTTEL